MMAGSWLVGVRGNALCVVWLYLVLLGGAAWAATVRELPSGWGRHAWPAGCLVPLAVRHWPQAVVRLVLRIPVVVFTFVFVVFFAIVVVVVVVIVVIFLIAFVRRVPQAVAELFAALRSPETGKMGLTEFRDALLKLGVAPKLDSEEKVNPLS
jgi:hypothetical protein